MKHLAKDIIAKPLAMLLALLLALLVPLGSANAQDRPTFSQQQLEQMLAPIALYPDPLLSQILMASTYPLEVVEAARWSRSHSNLVGEDAVRAAENENWDPSVKSLLAFPQVLARMDEDLQWLQTLGDAFLGQEPQVMDTVQNLRRRAQAAGNLRSDERQRIVENGPVVVVLPANPLIIYVPYYDPWVVYGPWWWPDYSPVYWRPFPGYYLRPGFAGGFYWGPSIRISVGYFFGAFDWSHRHVRVVQSNYYYSGAAIHRVPAVYRDRSPGRWQHDPVHRRGVAYRGAEVQQRFVDARTPPDSGTRQDREDARRQDPQRAQSYPTSNRRRDADRPAVQTGVQSNGAAKEQAAIQQLAQPYPSSNRQRESRNDVRRTEVQQGRDTAVQPVIQQGAQPSPTSSRQRESHDDVRRTAVQPARDTVVQPATQQVPVTQPHSGTNAGVARAERRDQVKGVDRVDRREPAESRQATRPANAVPQTQGNRGNATPQQSAQTERSARPHASESRQEPRSSPAARHEAQRGVERHKEEAQKKPEARPDSGWRRSASAEKVLPQ